MQTFAAPSPFSPLAMHPTPGSRGRGRQCVSVGATERVETATDECVHACAAPVKEWATEAGLAHDMVPPTGLLDWHPPMPFDVVHTRNLLLTASFGHLIPPSLLARFPPTQRLNLHPSLLPQLSGAAPIQWAIARQLDRTGVTVQTLGERFDSGSIYAQDEVVRACDGHVGTSPPTDSHPPPTGDSPRLHLHKPRDGAGQAWRSAAPPCPPQPRRAGKQRLAAVPRTAATAALARTQAEALPLRGQVGRVDGSRRRCKAPRVRLSGACPPFSSGGTSGSLFNRRSIRSRQRLPAQNGYFFAMLR